MAAVTDIPADYDAQSDGLRERKKLATRQALSAAALRLAVERGLDNVLVEDIAAEAGVSPRTFNNYFSGKYEAICAIAMDRGRLIGEALRQRPADEPLWEAISHAVLLQHNHVDQVPDKDKIASIRVVVSSPTLQGEYLKAQHVMQRALADAIAERTGTDAATDMFPQIMAGAVMAATQVAMERWIMADPPVALGPLMRQALRQLTEAAPAAESSPVPPAAGAATPTLAEPAMVSARSSPQEPAVFSRPP
jgi:AcrR family transcriptional regulator